MKKHFLFYLLLFAASSLSAQNVSYAYDNAGNRIERVISLIASPELRASEEVTELEDVVAKHEIRIYPNPTQGQLTVEIVDFNADLPFEFTLTDLSGKIIDRKKATSGYQNFNLSGQPDGIYLLRISIDGESTTWKIIKE
jgi:hypothetical protein